MPTTGFRPAVLAPASRPKNGPPAGLDNLSVASILLASGAAEVRTVGKAVYVPNFTGDAATTVATNWKKSEKVRRLAWTWF